MRREMKTATLPQSEWELCRIILPGIEDRRAAVGDMKYIAGCEVEAVFNRCGRKQRINHRGRVIGKAFDLAADGSPAQHDLIRHRENTSRKPGFKRRTHLEALCRLSPRSAAASRRLSRPSTTPSSKLFSTADRQSSMMVIVHSVSWVSFCFDNISFPVLDRMDNNLLKLHS